MKALYIFLATILFFSDVIAQDSTAVKPDTVWRRSGVYALNFTQTTLTNWAGGGQNSMAGNALLNYAANYLRGKNAWDNLIDAGYGLVMQGRDSKVIKNDDRMEFTTKYGHVATDHWFYSALLNFKSQFAPGYNYPNDSVVISRFLAPAYALAALGMDYKPSPYFSAFISPATMRFTIVNDKKLSDAGAFGVDTGKTVKAAGGAYAKVSFKKDLGPQTNFGTTLDLFSNYADNPQNLVVNWQMLLLHKIGKFLSVSVAAQLVYDDKVSITGYHEDGTLAFVGPRTQFKEMVGVGIAYKFNGVSVR